MVTAFVSIGSNIDRENNVQRAISALAAQFGAVRISPIYNSVAVGFVGPAFLNLVVQFDTTVTVERLVDQLHRIETNLGRDASMAGFADRTVDLDLLLYGELRQHDNRVDVPRGEILTAGYVLKPLIDLAPDLIHPETGLPFASYWRNVQNTLQRPMQVVELSIQL